MRGYEWLAGWLEGEGSFLVYHAKGGVPYPRVQAVSVDLDVLTEVARLMGGNKVRVHSEAREGRQRVYLVKVTGSKAVEVMRLVRPYMGARRGDKIDELLEQFRGSYA